MSHSNLYIVDNSAENQSVENVLFYGKDFEKQKAITKSASFWSIKSPAAPKRLLMKLCE